MRGVNENDLADFGAQPAPDPGVNQGTGLGPLSPPSPPGDLTPLSRPGGQFVCPAERIARATGLTRQAVYAGLQSVVSSAVVSGQGKRVEGRRFADLPMDWQIEITRRGVKRGFANGEDFLNRLPAPWKCPLSWDQVSAKERNKAVKLQKALARALAMRAEGRAPAAQIEAVGLEDYKREFGYPISGRHWQRLLSRTVARDAAEDNWQRLEIYLAETAFAAPTAKPEVVRNEYRHDELGETFGALTSRQTLTLDEKRFVWREALVHYKGLVDTLTDSPDHNRELRVLAESLVSYLYKAFPERTLAATLPSLKRRLGEKLDKWRNRDFTLPGLEEAIQDKRAENSGKFREVPFEADLAKIRERAELLHGDFERALTELIEEGKVSSFAKDLLEILREALRFEKLAPAYRELRKQDRLSQEFCGFYPFNARTAKSAVPKAIRKAVQPILTAALIWKHGPKRARLVSPCVRRDWSDTAPGDSTVYDDATPDHTIYGHVELPLTYDPARKSGLYIGRMEVLFAADERTDYPKAYVIILGEPGTAGDPKQQKAHYNMVHQRLVMIREHDRVGLPFKWFKLENGPWRNRLNDGEKLQYWDNIGYVSFANGLANATGRVVRHTTPGNPRSKIVERVFNAVWARMKRHPGYLGNNERLDRREAIQDFIRKAKAGKEHPGNELLSVSEYREVLDSELMAFANDTQNGMRLPGCSPKEAWHNGIDGHPGVSLANPLEQLPETARWVFASHERLEKVRVSGDNAGGITFNIGPIPYYFWGDELKPYQNETLLCRFNFEEPDLLCCQDREGKLFTVKSHVTMANTEPEDSLAQTARARSSWMREGKIWHDGLKHEVVSTVVRDRNYSAEVHEIGRVQKQDIKQLKAEKSQSERDIRRARQKAAAAGFDPSRLRVKNPKRAAEAAARLAARFARGRQEEPISQEAQ